MITWLYQPNSRELSAFPVCKLVQPAEFRLTCNGLMASLSGFVSWFSADFGMLGRFSHQRSIHRKRSTFKWLQRRAVRLNFYKSVFSLHCITMGRVVHTAGWTVDGHCARAACELRFCWPTLHLCFQVWPWQLTWGKQRKPIRKDQTECLAPGLSRKHAQWKVERSVSRMHLCNQGAEVVAQQQIWSVQICPEINAS